MFYLSTIDLLQSRWARAGTEPAGYLTSMCQYITFNAFWTVMKVYAGDFGCDSGRLRKEMELDNRRSIRR